MKGEVRTLDNGALKSSAPSPTHQPMGVLLAIVTLHLTPMAYLDAPLVPGSKGVGETGRYASPRTFDATVEYYKRHFDKGQVRWRHIVNTPGVKAVHIQSTRRSTRWSGINVYEKQGKVRVYVLKRVRAAAKSKRKRR